MFSTNFLKCRSSAPPHVSYSKYECLCLAPNVFSLFNMSPPTVISFFSQANMSSDENPCTPSENENVFLLFWKKIIYLLIYFNQTTIKTPNNNLHTVFDIVVANKINMCTLQYNKTNSSNTPEVLIVLLSLLNDICNNGLHVKSYCNFSNFLVIVVRNIILSKLLLISYCYHYDVY